MDERITAIRAHPLVGEGSCTHVDECLGDDDIVRMLDAEGVGTPKGAVAWVLDFEELKLEMGLNAREGSDDDEQLKIYQAFREELSRLRD